MITWTNDKRGALIGSLGPLAQIFHIVPKIWFDKEGDPIHCVEGGSPVYYLWCFLPRSIVGDGSRSEGAMDVEKCKQFAEEIVRRWSIDFGHLFQKEAAK